LAFNERIVMRGPKRQGGAALVEFAIVFVIYTALVFAIIEFAMATFNWSRMVQATQAGARYAITNDPACDVFGYRDEAFIPDCDSGAALDDFCTAGDEVHREISSSECSAGTNDSGCKIVEKMQHYSPYVLTGGSTVTVRYTCTDAGDPKLSRRSIPLVTVSADNVPYHFMMPGLLNIDATVTMPSFETTHVGEDLFTNTPIPTAP
jgi:hypothetical protein